MIKQHAVWLYLRFTLSYRDVEAGSEMTHCQPTRAQTRL